MKIWIQQIDPEKKTLFGIGRYLNYLLYQHLNYKKLVVFGMEAKLIRLSAI